MKHAGIDRSVPFALCASLALGLGGGRIAEAQEVPRYELSVGYVFLRDQDIKTSFPVGWNSSLALNLTNSFGVASDVGGSYKSEAGASLNVYAFLGGARYSFRGERVTPYVEGLVGVAQAKVSAGGMSESASDFAAQAGVGLGVKVSDSVSLRTGFDFRNIFSEGTSLQEYRVQVGLNFGFGESLGEGAPRQPRPVSREPRAEAGDGAEAPRYEVFAGYAFLRDQEIETSFPVGWNTSFALNLKNSLGVVADVGGSYKSEEGVSVAVHAFLGGVRYSFRGERVTPYVEGLLGLARASASAGGMSDSTSDPAIQVGAGIGFKVGDRVWLRTGFDFRNIFREGTSAQEYRVVAGVSFGFGGSREAPTIASSPRVEPPLPQEPPTVSAPAPMAPAPEAPPAVQPAQPRPQVATPSAVPPAAATGPFGRARELLRSGSYSEAADAFRADLPIHAPNMFTVQVGVYCDPSNLARQVWSANAEELVIMRLMLRGQACYGLYWGLFGSGPEAQAAMAQLPPALRAPGQAPISVSRLLARAP